MKVITAHFPENYVNRNTVLALLLITAIKISNIHYLYMHDTFLTFVGLLKEFMNTFLIPVLFCKYKNSNMMLSLFKSKEFNLSRETIYLLYLLVSNLI